MRATTNPVQLALWHRTGPVTVYATYASLPVIAEAMEGMYGQKLAPFDLAVIDEAHRTSGSWGKAWAQIHDNKVIPCLRRLYMTATPRIWQGRPASWQASAGARDPLPAELACSMDDEVVFGPVVYRLSLADAIARGLLARYQVIVVEIRDQEVTPERLAGEQGREEEVRGLRLGALQAAMLRTATEPVHRLQTMITFHHRTLEAQAFAEGLPATARRLHAADPERYPARVWAGWLHGEHDGTHRRSVLGAFGRRAGLAILSNCKVLGEGVDIRAVDSVALLDPKGSAVDIVQAIGRALRQKPHEGKVASLIVPVFLAPGEQPEDMLTSASYQPLIKVMQGLRAHDEQAVEMLATPQANSVRYPAETLGEAPDEGEEESRVLLRFSAPRDPVTVAQWISFNVLDVERQDWGRGYTAARRFYEREGHLLVPFEYTCPDSQHPLGSWISEQRKAYTAGAMNGKRAERLETLDMIWNIADHTFEHHLAAARVAFAEYGTLCLPRGTTTLNHPVGQWLTNLRRPSGLGSDLERAQRRAAQLEAIDPDWNPTWPIDWQRLYVAARECLTGGATLADLLPGVTVHGQDIGRWLARQRHPQVWTALSQEQRDRLKTLGLQPTEESERPARKVSQPRGDAFTRGLAALRQYRKREGHVRVPRQHLEHLDDGHQVKLGIWISNIKSPARWAKLSPDRAQALAELGIG